MLLDAQHNNIMLFVCVSFEPCNQLLLRLFTQRSPFLRAVLCFSRPNKIEGKIKKKSNEKYKELSNLCSVCSWNIKNFPTSSAFPSWRLVREVTGIGNFSNLFLFRKDCENLRRLIHFFNFRQTLFSVVTLFILEF